MSDFAEVRRLVAASTKKTYADLRAENPGEQFYAFALYDCDDATGPQVSANSEQKFQELLPRDRRLYEKRGRPYGPREEAYCRWGTAEWWYEACSDARDFAPAYELLQSLSAEASARDAYPEFRARAFAAMVGALCDLDREGLFGTGATREAITVFASLSDSCDARWLERESARVANPQVVFARFEREALAPPLEPTAESSGADRYQWEEYQLRLATPTGETHNLFMQLVAAWGDRA
jgi:hypothetical protein